MPLVSVSNAQRQPIAEANFAKTIYHGLPLDLLAPTYEARGGYLAFLGRISPTRSVCVSRRADGLFDQDTRYLSRLELLINGMHGDAKPRERINTASTSVYRV
jgi:N-terminal domain of (some) glycogen debranching enzymes